LDSRWYVSVKLRLKQTLGSLAKNKIKPDKDNLEEVKALLISFLNHEHIGSPKELAGHMAFLTDIMRNSAIRSLRFCHMI
jgi:hypothetical protein